MAQVSVCIIGRDVRPYLEESLPMIRRQEGVDEPEILFADNASEDGSGDVAAEHGARVILVPEAEFHHALTRRMLAEEASGEFLCMLTGDAVPYDSHWLRRLIEPLENDPLVALCYSRWLPRPNAQPVERIEISAGFPPISHEAYVPADDALANAEFEKNPYPYMFCQNVSSAYRRAQFLEIPFTKEIAITEDQFSAYWFLRRRFKTRYCALSRVWHSHEDSLAEERLRYRQCVSGFLKFCPVAPPTSRTTFGAFVASLAYALVMVGSGKARVRELWATFRSKLARRLGELDAARSGRD